MDKIDCIKTFIKVVQTGNFSSAARDLGITRDQVAKRICYLETLFNSSFFIRNTRKMSLTSSGEKFYQHALAIIHEFEGAQHELLFEQKYPGGTLKIALPYFVKSLGVESVIYDFLIKYPNIELDLCFTEIFQPLDEQKYDLVFKINHDNTAINKKQDLLLKSFNFNFYATSEYFEQHGIPKTLDELNEHHLIIYSNDIHKFSLLKNKSHKNIYANPQLICNHETFLLELCKKNYGIAILPDHLVKIDEKAKSLVRCLEQCHFTEWHMYVTASGKNKLPTKVDLFLNHVRDFF